jgi:hypothetical protein
MTNFAIIENNLVTNVLFAESSSDVTAATGLTCVEVTESTGNPAIGGTYDSKKSKFIPIQPYASWTLTADNVWIAPVAHPEDGKSYYWDEPTTSWVKTPGQPE